MSKRSKSRNEQRKPSGKEQKPKIAASEATATVKREDAPIARAPQTPAPKTPAPKASPPAPQPPRVATSPGKLAPEAPAPKASPPATKPPRVAAATAPSPEPRLLDNAVETMERSLKAAGQGTVAVNRKLIDFAQQNLSSSLDLARSLACARTPMQVMHLQVTYWDARMKVLASQAEELRALSAEIVAKANEPIREHMRRSLGDHAG
jgi:Phasin protein